MSPSRDDLAKLLSDFDKARAAFSAANCASVAAKDKALTVAERVALDIQTREALNASVAAEIAYDAALSAFIAAQREQVAA